VDYCLFAAKLRGLLVCSRQRRKSASSDGNRPCSAAADAVSGDKSDESEHSPPESSGGHRRSGSAQKVTLAALEARLPGISSILPTSQAALEVFQMVESGNSDARQIGAAIVRDSALAGEVLRLANSAFYNPSGKPIVEVEDTVALLGQKCVGELAFTTGSLATIADASLPWMDTQLAWRRSVAAGTAMELLLQEGGHHGQRKGLLASAIMHGVGRIVLGTLYPDHYRALIDACRLTNATLLEHEKKIFPETHAEVMARLLTSWCVPADVSRPLKNVNDDYSALSRLPEPVRTRVELVKVAAFVAKLVAGGWEPWDTVEVPPLALLKKLKIVDLAKIAKTTQDELQRQLEARRKADPADKTPVPDSKWPARGQGRSVPYCALGTDGLDLFELILRSLNFEPEPVGLGDGPNTLVNAVELPAVKIEALEPPEDASCSVVVTAAGAKAAGGLGSPLVLPCSVAALKKRLLGDS